MDSINCHLLTETECVTNQSDKPWVTNDIKAAIRQKNNLYSKYRRNPTERKEEKFQRTRNQAKNLIRAAKRKYDHDNLDPNLSTQTQWCNLNKLLYPGQKRNKVSSILHNGSEISDPHQIAEAFTVYFATIADQVINSFTTTADPISFKPEPSDASFQLNPVLYDEIEKIISDL